nr:multistep phosphorelay regulator 1 [Quercus suber]
MTRNDVHPRLMLKAEEVGAEMVAIRSHLRDASRLVNPRIAETHLLFRPRARRGREAGVAGSYAVRTRSLATAPPFWHLGGPVDGARLTKLLVCGDRVLICHRNGASVAVGFARKQVVLLFSQTFCHSMVFGCCPVRHQQDHRHPRRFGTVPYASHRSGARLQLGTRVPRLRECFPRPSSLVLPNAVTSRSAPASAPESSFHPSEDGSAGFPEFGENIDSATFEQILEMDDDEDEREFSRSIVYDFFTQADSTFEKMDEMLEKKDLPQLSALGHFLKGSSATLGLTKVKDSCEKIQHFGAKKDETGTHDETDEEKCLANCKKTIERAKDEFKQAEVALRKFYHDDGTAASATS